MQTHGISIGLERVANRFFMRIKPVGKLTHEDYELMVPMLESALEGVFTPEIRLLVDASEWNGWELRAAWDDFKLGLKHGGEFVKIAIVGHSQWQKMLSQIGSWFVSGDIRYFEKPQQALDWLFD